LPLGKLVANARNEPTQSHGNITMVAKIDEIASLPLAMTTVDDASLFIVIASEPIGERGNPMRISPWLQNLLRSPPRQRLRNCGRVAMTIFDEGLFKPLINIYPKPVIPHTK
jgi:hypothetical protein